MPQQLHLPWPTWRDRTEAESSTPGVPGQSLTWRKQDGPLTVGCGGNVDGVRRIALHREPEAAHEVAVAEIA
eukprot:1175523-Prorocentrum_minimum.AAC.2